MSQGYIYMFSSPEYKVLYNTDFIKMKLIEYSIKNNIKIIEHIEDDENKRPKLQKLLTEIKTGECIICWSISQFSWKTSEILNIMSLLNNNNIKLTLLTNPEAPKNHLNNFLISMQSTYETYLYKMYLKQN